MHFFDVMNAEEYGFEPQNYLLSLFYDKGFLVIAFTCFSFLSKFFYLFVLFFFNLHVA